MPDDNALQEASLYKQWQNAPLLQKTALTGIAALIIVFTLKNVVFYGQSRRMENLRRALDRQEQTITSCKTIADSLTIYQNRLSALQQNQSTRLLHVDDLPLALSKLTSLNDQDVKVTTIRPGQETTAENNLQKSLFLAGEGTLSNLALLMEQLESILPASTIDRVVLTRRTTTIYYCELFLTVHLTAGR